MNKTFALVGPKVDIAHDEGPIDDLWQVQLKKIPHWPETIKLGGSVLTTQPPSRSLILLSQGKKKQPLLCHGSTSAGVGLTRILACQLCSCRRMVIQLLVVQITEVLKTRFGAIDSSISGLDGPPVRDLDVWIKLHTTYWNGVLQGYRLVCCDDMPVHVEKFKLAYSP